MKPIAIFCLIASCLQSLAQQENYSIVVLNKRTDAAPLPKNQLDSIMKGHFANMERLSKEGKLLAAGPFEGGGGIFIMNSTSESDVTQWISADPGIQANRWRVEILPYQVRYGGICPVQPPYKMVHYTFVRFDAIVSKFNAGRHADIMRRHHAFLKQVKATGNVIAEALFSELDGGILVMKGEVQREVIEGDPGVSEGLIQFEIKKLYNAEGSFCEE